MPFAFTTVAIQPPVQEPPTPVLDDPNVQLDDVRLSQGRVYLIRPGERMVDLGRPVGNTVLARGARQGDELCVFAETAFHCPILTNAAASRLSGRDAWQPQLWLNSLNATTLQLWVNDLDGGSLNATVYANGQSPVLIPLTAGVTATISLSSQPLMY